ncbi:MAG: hypothetical protein OXU74_06500 [Gemmatimonadota bacterium]|nr:hypothetical protein [Gemmatimonadota bacterium]
MDDTPCQVREGRSKKHIHFLPWFEAWFESMRYRGGKELGEREWRGPCFHCGGDDRLYIRGAEGFLRTERVERLLQSVEIQCSGGCTPEEVTRALFEWTTAQHPLVRLGRRPGTFVT